MPTGGHERVGTTDDPLRQRLLDAAQRVFAEAGAAPAPVG